jgi:hypothetical protein
MSTYSILNTVMDERMCLTFHQPYPPPSCPLPALPLSPPIIIILTSSSS